MKTVPISNTQLVALVDDDDYDKIKGYTWRLNGDGYVITGDGTIALHRLIVNNNMTDHKDNDKLNCQKYNLRSTTHRLNGGNRRLGKNNTTGFKGVSYCSNAQKYKATICFFGKNKHLGYYDNINQAAIAYNNAAIKLFGEHAKLNEVSSAA
jgi:hypothetical protein